jgi:hypothetical protein
MRKWSVAAAVAVLALAVPGGAGAAFTQASDVALTDHHAGRSTGITSDVNSSNPTAPGQKPKPARRLSSGRFSRSGEPPERGSALNGAGSRSASAYLTDWI